MTTPAQGSELPGLWRLQVLGHVTLVHGAEVLPLFQKGLALVTYLVLEGQPHHREHLAELLWGTPDALGNLRVELLRLRRRGMTLLPPRQPMLALRCRTDLDDWEATPDHFASESELLEWLSVLRGLPLSGLEDLGTPAFGDWLDAQRSALLDRVEARLRRAASALAARRDREGVRLVAARAEALGLELGVSLEAPESAAPLPPAAVLWPDQHAQWREVLAGAQERPQLVLLRGEAGTRRLMLAALTQGTPWQTVKVHAENGAALCQMALKLQLRRVAGGNGPTPPPARRADSDSLLELAELLGSIPVPLLLVLHDPSPEDPWWTPLVSLALDLPGPLVVVVTAPTPGPATDRALAPLLRRVAGPRLHIISLPPLGVEEVSGMLRERLPERTPALEQDILAMRLTQCSEGSLPYVQALLERTPPAPDYRLPAPVSEVLLSTLTSRTPAERRALAQLAQVYGPVTPDLAAALLGDAAGEALALGVRLGLLVPVAATERLTLPALGVRTPDGAAALAFAHELTRCALAASLPAGDREALRRVLARALLPTDPARSLLYARRVGDRVLEARARAALPPWRALPQGEGLGPRPQDVPPPPREEHPRHEQHTPGGYRLISECGVLRVLRRGPPGPAPLLTLTWGAQAPCSVTLRLDLAPPPPSADTWPPPFALGLRAATGPRQVYAAGAVPPHEEGGVLHVFGGILPLGRWVRLSLPGPLTELSVRGGQVALTLAGAGITARTLSTN
ncbi:hypothetical protein [Deinococcus murrayi]|uniref:hypothetical protein n=1 Tax=Deinococcus murrayi TaxID=68910 RepID=UPI000B1B8DD3|nr:hypothetical protein [Deinococcus murrayi]